MRRVAETRLTRLPEKERMWNLRGDIERAVHSVEAEGSPNVDPPSPQSAAEFDSGARWHSVVLMHARGFRVERRRRVPVERVVRQIDGGADRHEKPLALMRLRRFGLRQCGKREGRTRDR